MTDRPNALPPASKVHRTGGGLARTKRWALLGATVAVCASVPAGAAVVQQGSLRISLLAQVQPYKLPRHHPAPIAVLVSGHVAATGGGVPDQLQSLQIKVNRHALLRTAGLPRCGIAQIQAVTTSDALAACAPALIGSGRFWAHIVFPEQGDYPTQGRLLVFNGAHQVCRGIPQRYPRTAGAGWPSSSRTQGGRRGERTVAVRDPKARDRGQRDAQCHQIPAVLVQIYNSHPFSSSFVIPFTMRRLASGRYGSEFTASLPESLGEWGYVDRIKLTLKREFRSRGRQLSYYNAACPAAPGADRAAFHLAYATFSFSGGRQIGADVTKACGVKE